MKAILAGLFTGMTLVASPIFVNYCGGSSTNSQSYSESCTITGSESGFGTTVFSVAMTAMGDNFGAGSGDPGTGGSGSVTINDTGFVAGTGTGYIEFFDYNETGIAYDIFGGAGASFSVGSIVGSIPGNDMVGVPRPLAGTLTPFELGTPFSISARVSFTDDPYFHGESETGYGSAVLDFSFSVFNSQGQALVVEDASSNPAAPEPGTAALGGLMLTLMLAWVKLLAPRLT